MRIPDAFTCLLRKLYADQEATIRTRHGTKDWLQIGKGVHQALHCHPIYLTYMQSTTCKMSGWMKHKLKSRFLGKFYNCRYADDTTIMAENEEELKRLLMKVKEESETLA